MADKKQRIFHSGSRKAFAEESYVIDAVQRAKNDVAKRHAHVGQGSALFKTFAHVSASAALHPRAVDIVNAAVGAAATAGHSTGAVAGTAGNDTAQPRRSGIAEARGEVAESLRRLGVR